MRGLYSQAYGGELWQAQSPKERNRVVNPGQWTMPLQKPLKAFVVALRIGSSATSAG